MQNKPTAPLGGCRTTSQADAPTVVEVLAAIAEALDVAIDLEQPYRTTSRTVSVHATVEAAWRGGPNGPGFLVSQLGQLVASWRAER